ncbi:TetR family transcriptional regulator [Nocardioides baekrokdamisoli]|uniref:TetR family transcriptional regulator n=1 Tax=Nocardioides baekrokdamisoli TaxID=1804624 RepID=A0A3G9J0E5_9ACTN|nr:TetR/AcrR family transcriptional regulator [Nocardioides baekrokdamisoli]BBH16934.1 TetR family transcriptional regulator [Nocardioides baekrokdamisoli]
MPTPTWERLDPARRNAVIAAAEDEFAEHGFSSGSLNAIARNAGVAKGSLFQYFTDKADLYAYMAERASTRVRDAMAEHIASADWAGDYWGAMTDLLVHWQAYFFTHPLERAFTEAVNLESERAARPAIRRAVNDFYIDSLRPLLTLGQDLGVVGRDTDIEAVLALLLMVLPQAALAPHNAYLDPLLGLGDADPTVRRQGIDRIIALLRAMAA